MTYYWKGEELVTDSYRFRLKPNRIDYQMFEDGFLHFLDILDWRSLLSKETNDTAALKATLSKTLLERQDNTKLLEKLERLLVNEDAPPKTLLNRLKDVEAREEQLEATITRLRKEIDLKREERQTISDPHELRLAIRETENIETRFRLREEIRRRVSGIEIKFRGPVIITNITFVTGAVRQIVFLDREGDYKTIDAEEAVKMMSTAVDKRLLYPTTKIRPGKSRRSV